MNESAAHTAELDPRHEARSPPGQWRLLAAALPCWAVTAWSITVPGSSGVIAVGASLLGCAMLVWWAFSRAAPQHRATVRAAMDAAQIVANGAETGVLRSRVRNAAKDTAAMLLIGCAMLVLVGTQASTGERARADPSLSLSAEQGRAVSFSATLTGFPKYRPSPFGERGWVTIDAHSPSGRVPMLLWLGSDDLKRLRLGTHSQETRNAGSEAAFAPGSVFSPGSIFSSEVAHWGPGTLIEVRARLEAQGPAEHAAYTASALELRQASQGGHPAAALRNMLSRTAAGVPGAELVPGFAVGDTSLVSQQLEQAMLESSLTHLTAVSGSNTGLVIAVVLWCASRLGVGRRCRIVAATIGLAGFVIIVGPDASVQRATAMAAVLLIGDFGGRRSSALPALGLAVLVLLALDPWQALQPGFALSVAATGGILLSATPISKWLRRRARLPAWLSLPFAVAVAAQFACGPLLLLLQPGIPVVGVLANVIAAPAAPLGTGIGLLAALLGPVSAQLAHLAVRAASVPARWVAATAEVCAGLPAARWSWPEGWLGAALLAACQLALLVAWALSRGHLRLPWASRAARRLPWRLAQPAAPKIRLAASMLRAASLATVVVLTLVAPLGSRLMTPRGWSIVACDIGQGDAILLRDPALPSQVMLVDTGDDPQALGRCLDRFGVDRISLLVLSHDDRDHVGALESVVGRVDAALIAPTVQGEQSDTRQVVRTLGRAGVPFQIGVQGLMRSSPAPGIDWRVLSPSSGSAPVATNAASLVMHVDAGPTRVLLLGDTRESEQAALLRAVLDLNSHVLKVAHHGSGDQDHTLPAEASAQWALVSVGADNGYGHPAPDTLATLARSGTRALRTDLFGSIALVPQPDGSLKPWVEHSPASRDGADD